MKRSTREVLTELALFAVAALAVAAFARWTAGH